MTAQPNPEKIRKGFWVGTTFFAAENAKLDQKGENLFLKNVVVLTIRGRKGVGAFFKGNFEAPLKEVLKR